MAMLVALALGTTARADRITLLGTDIPQPPGEVQHIEAGRIAFLDQRGRMSRMDVRAIRWVFFDDLPLLEQAEQTFEQGEHERGLTLLLRANLEAASRDQRIWTHIRLAQVHEARGEIIEATGHVAAIVRLDDHSAWAHLEPVVEPLPTNLHAVIEARDRVQRARTAARDMQVREMLDRMLRRVERAHEEAIVRDGDAAVDPGATISGYLIDALREDRLQRPGDAISDVQDEDEEVVTAPSPTVHDGETFETVRMFIEREQWLEALRECERIANEPGGVDLAEFFYHYGLVLRASDRERDAAVTFMRSAIHFPDSYFAPICLIETAALYRDAFDNPRTARRLLERAAMKLTDDHEQRIHHRVRDLLDSLPEEHQ